MKCVKYTNCDAQGRQTMSQGTPTSDAVCGRDKQCKCANGVPATGIHCPTHGSTKCISCRGKYYLDNGLCLPWQDCDKRGKVEFRRGSNTANAQCGRAKQCECEHGTGATGTACPTNGDAKCVKCDVSHWLDTDHKCQKRTTTTPTTTPTTGTTTTTSAAATTTTTTTATTTTTTG